MKLTRMKIGIAAVVGLALLAVSAGAVLGIGLTDIVKVGGIAYLVDRYDSEIDTFITSALGEREAAAQGATKVVPIISLGGGGYIGAAQVVGNPEQVKRVKVVVQVEGKFGSFGAKVLIPTTTSTPSGTPDRVKGVGVSAVVEFQI
jgi:hypothetical protein